MSPQDLAVIESTSWIKSEKLHMDFGKLEHFLSRANELYVNIGIFRCICATSNKDIFQAYSHKEVKHFLVATSARRNEHERVLV